ncbi:hypothetical protein KFK09_000507 [Dendrobium nobile]|uniref:Transmembrane protein n=1 Tax=Dendrobium nobile TaxID=94219 RepID=A0A8T3C8U1_DENNO|nr:hypothetical protein KFK09_000507 [Dendrobium nobile]
MDCEQEELQFLGIIGIYREASKLIVSRRRLFSRISVNLIVRLSLHFVVHIHISYVLFSQIDRNEYALEHTAAGSPSQTRLLHGLSSEWFAFLSKSIYHHALLVFSLLSNTAVVPNVWRRLALTFLFGFLFLVSFDFIAIIVLDLTIFIAGENVISIVIIIFLSLAYLVGLVWISVVWHLASVVSVLEEAYGLAAMRRSKDLVKGKIRIAATMFLKMNLAFIGIELLFRRVVVVGEVSMSVRVVFAMAMLGFMSVVMLFALVAQTVLYCIFHRCLRVISGFLILGLAKKCCYGVRKMGINFSLKDSNEENIVQDKEKPKVCSDASLNSEELREGNLISAKKDKISFPENFILNKLEITSGVKKVLPNLNSPSEDFYLDLLEHSISVIENNLFVANCSTNDIIITNKFQALDGLEDNLADSRKGNG